MSERRNILKWLYTIGNYAHDKGMSVFILTIDTIESRKALQKGFKVPYLFD